MCQAVAALAGVERIVYAATAELPPRPGSRCPPARPRWLAAVREAGGVELEYIETPGAEAPFTAWAAVAGAGHGGGPRCDRVSPRPVSEFRLAVTVADFDRAIAFYRDTFELPELEAWATPEGRGAVLDTGRATLELVNADQADLIDSIEVERRVAGPMRIALEVADWRRPPNA